MNPEQLVKDYVCLQDEKEKRVDEMIKDTKVEQDIIDRLSMQLEEAEGVLEKNREPHMEGITELEHIQSETKELLAIIMGPEKALDLDIAKVEKRVTKTLSVVDKAAVVDVLKKLGKVDKGVKAFDLKYLRKLVEADAFPEDATEFTERHNIYVRRREE